MLTPAARRRVLLTSLYFSEGAPIGYLWWALPTKLSAAGVAVEEVTALTAALALPWALKFLWAPLVDALQPRRLGRRAWIAAAQLGMGLALVPVVADPPGALPGAAVWGALLAHAVLAATQDVAIDGFAIDVLPPGERGAANAWMQAGMLAGRGAFGGLSLQAEAWIGASGVLTALIGCIWVSTALLWLVPQPPDASSPVARRRSAGRGLGALLRRRSTWLGIDVALLGGAAFEAVGGTAGPLLVDRGFAKEEVGAFFALPTIACMAAGAFAGGWLADRRDRASACAAAVVLVAAAVAVLAAGLWLGASGLAVMVLLSLVYLALGVLTASSYALFMDLADPRVAATQFSLFMAATNLCEVWSVRSAGWLEPRVGYGSAYLVLAAASLLALPPLLVIKWRGRAPAVTPRG